MKMGSTLFATFLSLIYVVVATEGSIAIEKYGENANMTFYIGQNEYKIIHRRHDDVHESVVCSSEIKTEQCIVRDDTNYVILSVYNATSEDTGTYGLKYKNADQFAESTNLTLYVIQELSAKISVSQISLGPVELIPRYIHTLNISVIIQNTRICKDVKLVERENAVPSHSGRVYSIECTPDGDVMKKLKPDTAVTFLFQHDGKQIGSAQQLKVTNVTKNEDEEGTNVKENDKTFPNWIIVIVIGIGIFILLIVGWKKRKFIYKRCRGQDEDNAKGGRPSVYMNIPKADGETEVEGDGHDDQDDKRIADGETEVEGDGHDDQDDKRIADGETEVEGDGHDDQDDKRIADGETEDEGDGHDDQDDKRIGLVETRARGKHWQYMEIMVKLVWKLILIAAFIIIITVLLAARLWFQDKKKKSSLQSKQSIEIAADGSDGSIQNERMESRGGRNVQSARSQMIEDLKTATRLPLIMSTEENQNTVFGQIKESKSSYSDTLFVHGVYLENLKQVSDLVENKAELDFTLDNVMAYHSDNYEICLSKTCVPCDENGDVINESEVTIEDIPAPEDINIPVCQKVLIHEQNYEQVERNLMSCTDAHPEVNPYIDKCNQDIEESTDERNKTQNKKFKEEMTMILEIKDQDVEKAAARKWNHRDLDAFLRSVYFKGPMNGGINRNIPAVGNVVHERFKSMEKTKGFHKPVFRTGVKSF